MSFIDAEDSSQYGKGQSFKEIALNHLNRILNNTNHEFRGGFWEVKEMPIIKDGVATIITTKNYKEDTREIYCNSVLAFADLLLPRFDKDTSDKENVINEKLEALRQEYLENTNYKKISQEDFDKFKQTYRDERIIYCRKLFRVLNLLCAKEKYFEMKGTRV